MYDQQFWNERYATKEYLYGTEANTFLVENAHLLHGPVLSLSEGEGRNAVYMASLGSARGYIRSLKKRSKWAA